jgi:hypothetical protein
MDPLATRCTTVGLPLLSPVAPGGTGQVKLYLRATTPREADRFGRIQGIDFWGDALPVMAVHDEQGWHTKEPYTDQGESFYQLASQWDVQIKLPQGMQIATTGTGSVIASSKLSQIWQFQAPRARNFMITAGNMRVASVMQDSIKINLWYSPSFLTKYPNQIKPSLTWAKRSVQSFNRWFGYYNKRELDILVGVQWPAMEFSDIVSTSPDPTTLSHEIAHQWWYSMLGDNQYRSPWLDESFAEYSSMRALRKFDPNYFILAEPCQGLDDPSQTGLWPWSTPLSSSMQTWEAKPDAYSNVVYGEGSCRIEQLTKRMGAAATNKLFHYLMQHYRDGILTTDDMLAAIRRWAPAGVDVDQWIAKARIQTGS